MDIFLASQKGWSSGLQVLLKETQSPAAPVLASKTTADVRGLVSWQYGFSGFLAFEVVFSGPRNVACLPEKSLPRASLRGSLRAKLISV